MNRVQRIGEIRQIRQSVVLDLLYAIRYTPIIITGLIYPHNNRKAIKYHKSQKKIRQIRQSVVLNLLYAIRYTPIIITGLIYPHNNEYSELAKSTNKPFYQFAFFVNSLYSIRCTQFTIAKPICHHKT